MLRGPQCFECCPAIWTCAIICIFIDIGGRRFVTRPSMRHRRVRGRIEGDQKSLSSRRRWRRIKYWHATWLFSPHTRAHMMNSVSIQIDHGAAGGTVRWPSKKKFLSSFSPWFEHLGATAESDWAENGGGTIKKNKSLRIRRQDRDWLDDAIERKRAPRWPPTLLPYRYADISCLIGEISKKKKEEEEEYNF